MAPVVPASGLGPLADDPVGTAAHIVQTALTPIFLLNGIGTLLALFNTRQARVRDHMARLTELLEGDVQPIEEALLRWHMRRLANRVLALDLSIVLGACGGAATCGSVFILFLGDVRGADVARWLIILFGAALGCTIGSLLAFLADSVLAWHAFRQNGSVPLSTRASRTPSV